jgi:hypothetical protein
MRPPGSLIRARGRTGIPKWVAIPRRLYRYDGSELPSGRTNWILSNPMKAEIPLPCESPALKKCDKTPGQLGRRCARRNLRVRVLRRYAGEHARIGVPSTVRGKRAKFCSAPADWATAAARRFRGTVRSRSSATHGSHQSLPTDRQGPQALTRGGKYRVAEGRGHQWDGGFADAAGRLVAVHEMHVELG